MDNDPLSLTIYMEQHGDVSSNCNKLREATPNPPVSQHHSFPTRYAMLTTLILFEYGTLPMKKADFCWYPHLPPGLDGCLDGRGACGGPLHAAGARLCAGAGSGEVVFG